MPEQEVIKIDLRVDWRAGPFWLWRGDVLPEEFDGADVGVVLPLSEELTADIIEWDAEYQGKWDLMMNDEAIFASDADRASFLDRGRALARRVRAECPPEVTVTYAGDGTLDELIS